jgi:hypothetical protein
MMGLLAAAALASLVQVGNKPDAVCYDLAIAGHIRHAEDFVGLDKFIRLEGDEISFGGRWDVDIDVDKIYAGNFKSVSLKARVVSTTMFSPKARLLILLKNGPVEADKDNTLQEWGGRYIPRPSYERPWSVVFVQSSGMRFDPDDPSLPPRCS